MATLDNVKAALNIVGDFADGAIQAHIDAVTGYLARAGVSGEAIAAGKADGAIIRGVADLWNTQSGGVGFSPVFTDMVIQLAVTEPETDAETEGGADDGATLS